MVTQHSYVLLARLKTKRRFCFFIGSSEEAVLKEIFYFKKEHNLRDKDFSFMLFNHDMLKFLPENDGTVQKVDVSTEEYSLSFEGEKLIITPVTILSDEEKGLISRIERRFSAIYEWRLNLQLKVMCLKKQHESYYSYLGSTTKVKILFNEGV